MNVPVISQEDHSASTFSFSEMPPLSLYIHLPWCIRKCPYCDFNSHEISNDKLPESSYIEALIRDVDFAKTMISDRVISSIFFGGGTPSLLSSESLKTFLMELSYRVNLSEGPEITLEANPGTVDMDHFFAYRDAGVNRISVGIQSFNDEMLKKLGRIHDSSLAQQAIEAAHSAGFERINLDLMYGLPGQRSTQAMDDLKQAIANSPGHISWYQLTIEPNTIFYKHRPELPDDDEIWTIQEMGQAMLSDAGYINYEISAHGLPGQECRHNLNYWTFGDYLGVGAGAHSKITQIEHGVIVRQARHRLPDRYMKLAGTEDVMTDEKYLDETDVILEFMMNALRLNDGFSLSMFERRTGLGSERIESHLEKTIDQGWLTRKSNHIQTTRQGKIFLNDLLQCFMPEAQQISNEVQAER